MKRCCVYVLKSLLDGNFYVGITDNLENRFHRHNEGRVSSTKTRRPFVLVHHEDTADYKAAREREKFLKSCAGRQFISGLIYKI